MLFTPSANLAIIILLFNADYASTGCTKNACNFFYEKEAFSEENNIEYFWCDICEEKINFYSKEHLHSHHTENFYLSWFFSHNVEKEDLKTTHLLKLINK